MANVTLKIQGMSCGHCVGSVNKALKDLPGLADLDVKIGSASFSYDPAKVTVEQIKEAIEEEGYQVV